MPKLGFSPSFLELNIPEAIRSLGISCGADNDLVVDHRTDHIVYCFSNTGDMRGLAVDNEFQPVLVEMNRAEGAPKIQLSRRGLKGFFWSFSSDRF
jgi:hypothetical protein